MQAAPLQKDLEALSLDVGVLSSVILLEQRLLLEASPKGQLLNQARVILHGFFKPRTLDDTLHAIGEWAIEERGLLEMVAP